jgi:hypothetical protein
MLDTITWGNPSQKHQPFLDDGKSFLDRLVPQLVKFTFPKNSSKATREELNELVDNVKLLTEDPETLKRYRAYDASLTKVFADMIVQQQLGDRGIQLVDQLIDDTVPVIMKLKFHFQRPRPYQMAQYYKLKLFPFYSRSDQSPSYPSGHALQAKVICHVLGNHFPDRFDYFESLMQDIQNSRIYMGIHYPSDTEYANLVAETIIRDKEFKQKYQL